ncbi:hypothetical protein [Mycobacterium sp.]|uniref:hypothetical protein n=1 Tax=Mycobacterium sp. TaxID=1785 RepID=UPI003D09BBFD
MIFAVGPDRFDEIRRSWIAKHQGWSTIQRRRAERLGRRVRARQRHRASAVPDPHDDTVLPPIWLRTAKSSAAQFELVVVTIFGLLVPLGWLGGWAVKTILVQSIPARLRGFPIAALLCSGAGLGLLTLVLSYAAYDPEGSLGEVALLPWGCLQLAAVPAAAGVYGVADGWLAVSGSRQWWPLTPARRPLSSQDAAEILAGYDLTGPGLVDARRLNEPGERTRA